MSTGKQPARQSACRSRARTDRELNLLEVERCSEDLAQILRLKSRTLAAEHLRSRYGRPGVVDRIANATLRLLDGRWLLPPNEMEALTTKPWFGNWRDERYRLLTGQPSGETLALENALSWVNLDTDRLDWIFECAEFRLRIAQRALELHCEPVTSPVKPRRAKASIPRKVDADSGNAEAHHG
jgi:hypothetical protein